MQDVHNCFHIVYIHTSYCIPGYCAVLHKNLRKSILRTTVDDLGWILFCFVFDCLFDMHLFCKLRECMCGKVQLWIEIRR